jgi:hypothetical protein
MTMRVLTFLFFILSCSQITLACTCGSTGPQPCAGLSPANVVFAGTVLNAGDLPKHLEFAEEIPGGPLPPLELPAHASSEANLTALPTGRIRGHVLGPDGKPLGFAGAYLFRRESPRAIAGNPSQWGTLPPFPPGIPPAALSRLAPPCPNLAGAAVAGPDWRRHGPVNSSFKTA